MLDGYVGASSIFATSRLQGPWFNLEHGLGCCHFVFCLISQCLNGFSPGSFERGLPTLNFPELWICVLFHGLEFCRGCISTSHPVFLGLILDQPRILTKIKKKLLNMKWKVDSYRTDMDRRTRNPVEFLVRRSMLVLLNQEVNKSFEYFFPPPSYC